MMTNLSNRKALVRDRSRMTGTILRSLSDHLTTEENHCKRISIEEKEASVFLEHENYFASISSCFFLSPKYLQEHGEFSHR